MKKKEITVGGRYYAKVSGKSVVVRVDAIREVVGYGKTWVNLQTVYDVTNRSTGRKTTFRSAQRFIGPVKSKEKSDETKGEGSEGRGKEVRNPAPAIRPGQSGDDASRNQVPGDEADSTCGEKQQALADKLKARRDTGADDAPHVIVEARAGSFCPLGGQSPKAVEEVAGVETGERRFGEEIERTPETGTEEELRKRER